jgi:hypothetical protein
MPGKHLDTIIDRMAFQSTNDLPETESWVIEDLPRLLPVYDGISDLSQDLKDTIGGDTFVRLDGVDFIRLQAPEFTCIGKIEIVAQRRTNAGEQFAFKRSIKRKPGKWFHDQVADYPTNNPNWQSTHQISHAKGKPNHAVGNEDATVSWPQEKIVAQLKLYIGEDLRMDRRV